MTQTRKDALQELLAKVEGDGLLASDLIRVFKMHPTDAASLKHGSLDAALALHNAVLTGWSWVKPDGPEMGTIRIFWPDNGDCYPSAVGKASDPARAWLCAILKALIAQEGKT